MFIAHHNSYSRAGSQRNADPAHFRCFQGLSVLAANVTNEAIVNIDPHHRFAVNDFLFMHNYFLNQCVQEFFGQFGDVRVLLHQGRKFLCVTALTGIVSKQGLNLIVWVLPYSLFCYLLQVPSFSYTMEFLFPFSYTDCTT